jgi:5-methylcytosine-specific restriction endonuclease McrA
MSRTEFTRKTKAQGFERSGGKCEICGVRLMPGKFRFDHKLPCALGGDNSLENLVVQCVACDKPKTADDVRRIRKADRQKAVHIGAKAPSRNPMPGSKVSGWKRKMNGNVEKR